MADDFDMPRRAVLQAVALAPVVVAYGANAFQGPITDAPAPADMPDWWRRILPTSSAPVLDLKARWDAAMRASDDPLNDDAEDPIADEINEISEAMRVARPSSMSGAVALLDVVAHDLSEGLLWNGHHELVQNAADYMRTL